MAKKTKSPSPRCTDLRSVVDEELKSLETAYKRVSKSKTTAKNFLISAGILDKKGNLAKAYR
jgi:hypothetical protein